MRRRHVCVVAIVLAGVAAADAAVASQIVRLAQSQPAPVMPRQRALGVPMAPHASGTDRDMSDLGLGDRAATPYRTPRDERAGNVRNPDRDLPMPRGVPSIIAP